MPEKKWIAQLIQPGTSLGGARPKAGVLDEEGRLCIAKFPSRNDDYDAGLWEHFSHLLALQAGIHVAETRLWGGLGKYHTLLSKRFDRTDEGRRIHLPPVCLCWDLKMETTHKVVTVIWILWISFYKDAVM